MKRGGTAENCSTETWPVACQRQNLGPSPKPQTGPRPAPSAHRIRIAFLRLGRSGSCQGFRDLPMWTKLLTTSATLRLKFDGPLGNGFIATAMETHGPPRFYGTISFPGWSSLPSNAFVRFQPVMTERMMQPSARSASYFAGRRKAVIKELSIATNCGDC